MKHCPLCLEPGGELLWQSSRWRVVRVDDAHYPGFCRVIWQAHVAEMTDLAPAERDTFMAAVFAVEAALRQLYQPDKINLASLGNQAPHLHWHVIPRWRDDRHFPAPIWGRARQKKPATIPTRAVIDSATLRGALKFYLG